MATPVFYDAKRKRWKRLRRLFDALGIAITLLVAFFVISVIRGEQLPGLFLPQLHRPYHAFKEKERKPAAKAHLTAHRKTKKQPTQVALNAGEGIRGAFYVKWDAGSFASLREYYPQIDLLFPEWLHVLTPDGRLQAYNQQNEPFDVIQNGAVRQVDNADMRGDPKVMTFLKSAKAETEVLPLVNNFDGRQWVPSVAQMFMDPAARARFRQQVAQFLASDKYRGLTVDFETFPTVAQSGYRALVSELNQDLHAKGMKLYVSVPVHDTDFDYGFLAAHSDGVIVMNYDEHYRGGVAGPIASQEWFSANLRDALKQIPRDKLICAVGGYGYDWMAPNKRQQPTPEMSTEISAQRAWLTAQESESDIEFGADSLNPHYVYLDENNRRHDVWFLDGVTALNQMRAAQQMGIETFALWRLGAEDRSLWSIWDAPGEAVAPGKLRQVPPGQEVDDEGQGEILSIGARPSGGERKLNLDSTTGLITSEEMSSLPTPYELDQYGGNPKQIAITFDDGPDPQWTPRILDALKAENAKATFFLIGMEAEKFPDLALRVYREGHEIGNHTWTHPDISAISPFYMEMELNLTERLFAARLGVKPLLFRPPYSIDQEPDTADQVKPLEIVQKMGYTTVGDKIDPQDWQDRPRRLTAQEIASNVFDHLPPCEAGDQECGNIILLHDGGGDRSATVAALPLIIRGLRQRGFDIVPVSTLVGKSYAEVMTPVSGGDRWAARVNAFSFWLLYACRYFIVVVFFVGDVLMTGRLLIVGLLAIYDRLRGRHISPQAAAEFRPSVAVLIPAYNEEKVIARTVRAALDSDYPDLRVIVVDDGSSDRTLAVLHDTFAVEAALGRVLLLTKPNSGKAEALNFALQHVSEEIFVGIDADKVIAPSAISRLVPHFLDARVAAVAGNAKVGNRVNLWTRWQALEYITSQNFERRALDVFGAVSVVPGAIGAWRMEAVRKSGFFQPDTVAEDADLTMSLLRRGYRVEYEDLALAYTEAPSTAKALMRQRFRWSFGILQAVWKHRTVFGRKGVLGRVALPNIFVFQILLPLVSPFIDVMFTIGALGYVVDRHFHPDTADPGSFVKLVAFFLIFLVIDFVASATAFALERRGTDHRENVLLLGHVWLQRFAYRQLFSLVLVKTLKRAIDGRSFNWDKLERTAEISYAKAGQR